MRVGSRVTQNRDVGKKKHEEGWVSAGRLGVGCTQINDDKKFIREVGFPQGGWVLTPWTKTSPLGGWVFAGRLGVG